MHKPLSAPENILNLQLSPNRSLPNNVNNKLNYESYKNYSPNKFLPKN